MQNVIVGTAGHVDHGKTCLIKALTGTDTDRLKEEQKRGITIELGFANLPNDAGIHIGIIDVPGHEKFVKNMLAGIGGIDLVLLVVALDEGVMPQTVEHFEILKMLHIKQGIVVFTKADLVDEDWAELVNDDVDNLVKGTFMEKADRIQVSAYTGKNIDVLKQMIVDKVRAAGARRQEKELFRLPIDRVFTMEGFGTVVTGTLLEGCCQVGQEVELYPTEKTVKIREIQTHGHKVDMAYAGQRTALNLVNIKKDEINRGDVLAAQDSLLKSQFIDAKVQLFSSTDRELRNGDRVHINYGSAQAICKAVLLDKDVLSAGEEAYVQFRFDEPVAVRRNDRFIIRFYSPTITFGGGIVLEAEALKHKRNHEEVIDSLHIKELGTDLEVLELELKEESRYFPVPKILAAKLNWTNQETEEQLEVLVKGKKAVRLSDGSFIHKDYWNEITQYGTELLNQFHKENPISDGMEKEEFKSRILDNFKIRESKKADVLLNEMIKRSITVTMASAIAAAGFNAEYSHELKGMLKDIEDTYLKAGYEIPATDDVIGKFKDKKMAKQIVNDLVKKGTLIKINP
jgi:selenocysteine-specific elongation factor